MPSFRDRAAVGLLSTLLLAFTSTAFSQQSVELCLALDGSGSVSASDFTLQLEGYASAIEDGTVVPRDSSVDVIVVQFSNSAQVELGPTTIDSAATANQMATDIRNIAQIGSGTNIASSITTCENTLQFQSGYRQVIDVSTDGQDSSDVVGAADSAVSAGVDAINAIGVGSGVDVTQLEALVRPQPASTPPDPGFVLTVSDFAAFTPAIEAKIQAEITGGGAARPVPAMSFAGTLSMILLVLVASLIAVTVHWRRS